MAKPTLNPQACRQLQRLALKLNRLIALSAPQARDPATGAFRAGSTISADAIRKAWTTAGQRVTPDRNAYKETLLAALRSSPRP